MFFTVNLSQDSSKLSNYVSNTLLEQIEKTLERGEKILLYLNKRGAYSSMICKDCEYLFGCPNCDISLSVHNNPKHLMCHLCTHKYHIPDKCPKCRGTRLSSIGIGTQQIEEILKNYFTDKNIFRFDSDSVRNISSKKQALSQLETADIIIGTKMITTGFDFEKIGCIGIMLVEGELGYQSFNAEEKAYSNLKQIIGRGNRKSQETTIILQTFIPKNPVIQRLTENNFRDFFLETLAERKEFGYPPYNDMVTLEYRHKDSQKAVAYTKKLESLLKSFDANTKYHFLRGSSAFKKNNLYHSVLIIKGENVRDLLKEIESTILRESSLSVIFQ